MGKPYKNSLLIRLGITMTAITLLGFLTMLGSIIIEEMTQGEAAAINQAGSLRMQSYRIATSLVYNPDTDAESYWNMTNRLVSEFEERLTNARLTTIIPNEPNHVLRVTYQRVEDQWRKKIRPVLLVYVNLVAPKPDVLIPLTEERRALWESNKKNIRSRYLSIVDSFVDDIDKLVMKLEEDAESKIRWLRLIQISSMFLIIAIVFKAMYVTQTAVLPPLRDLLDFAQRARRGDLSMRIQHQTGDELGQLGSAFNGMADDLSKIYQDLEQRVRNQTADLERSNRTLELLYKTTTRLNDAGLSSRIYKELLIDIERLIGLGPGIICLAKNSGIDVVVLASTRKAFDKKPALCLPENCQDCMAQKETLIKSWQEDGVTMEAVTIPLKEQREHYGILFISVPKDQNIEEWQIQLLEAIAGHISVAIGRAYRASAKRRLALHEERGVIARELHDSLAQSLSYLKIQVSRLNKSIGIDPNNSDTQAVANEIREGLNGAYGQLRELLTTFRLKPDEKGFYQALTDTISEFNQHGNIAITLDNQLHNLQLNENEEIHVTQVIREALSNVVRHAQATRAKVSLSGGMNDSITVTIKDNGKGIPPAPERRRHYGLAIMNERVSSLNGTLGIQPAESGGTVVSFSFTPKVQDTTFNQLPSEA